MYRSLTLALFLVSFLWFTGTTRAAVHIQSFESPNGIFKIEICSGPMDQTWAHVFYKGKKFLTLNNLGFLLDDDSSIPSVFLSKEYRDKLFSGGATTPDKRKHEGARGPGPEPRQFNGYNESDVEYIGLMKIIFRAYDEGIAFCYEFETKNDEPIKIKQELTTFKFDNLHPFRENRSTPEVLEEFHVNKIKEGYASLRIEKISDCPTLIAGEVPFHGFVPIKLPTKFQPDMVKPTTVNLMMNGDAVVEGIGRSVRTPWRFVKIEQKDDMLESLDITRNRL